MHLPSPEVALIVNFHHLLEEGGYEAAGAMIYYGLPGPYNEEVEDRIIGKVGQVMKRVKRPPVR